MLFGVTKGKEEELIKKMLSLGIKKGDLEEKFVKGSGPGGQKINKSSSCVFLMHVPSGISVKYQGTRSLAQNRFFARRLLAEKIEEIQRGAESAKRKEIEKIRRQKRKRSKRAKEKILQMKKMQSEKKSLRAKVSGE